ncbi:MAG TPA: OmpW family outer membrane protein [Acidocella sp.]|nr:OmpW family outer membrane protein [Acidocella sp.]HQU03361.1 OmpW family outer membrane protein [Acidocella sp.]
MKKSLSICIVSLVALSFAAPALAQAQTTARTNFQAGDFLVRLRGIDVIPENFSSSVSVVGGHVDATQQFAPEVDLSYFLTNRFSLEVIAATTRHNVSAKGTVAGKIDVGSVWVLPPTVTVQYHFPTIAGFTPYAGVGLTVAFFYDSHPAGGIVTKAGYSTAIGPTLDAGFDYSLGGNWYANIDVKQMFLNTTARLDGGAVVAKTALSPTVVGVGIGYRF